MALPSARRPAAVTEVLEQEKVANLKICLRKEDVFMKAIGEWCANLHKKKRSTLTKKVMLRRATYEAHRLNLSYEKLPQDWMRTLINQHELILYKRKKKYLKYKIDMTMKVMNNSSDSDVDEDKIEVKNDTGAAPPPVLKKVRTQGRSSNSNSTSSITPPVDNKQQMKKFKKMIDLSNEPPPGWWLQFYAKGIVLPRELRVYSTESETIIFYDYEQDENEKKEDDSAKFVQLPHSGYLNFDWWAKKTFKDEVKKDDNLDDAHTAIYF